ncbi:MAG: helix-turn-helix domain-containing protein [Chloroflexi bacterium]|nr:helix-turn-helix domain-containing protein [Chloroflexota bacterium]
MDRTPEDDLERELQDLEKAKLFGAADAKAEFAVVLARARRESHITQKELADKMGLSQPYIAKLEGGDANPTLGKVGSILAALGLCLRMRTEALLSKASSADLQDADWRLGGMRPEIAWSATEAWNESTAGLAAPARELSLVA